MRTVALTRAVITAMLVLVGGVVAPLGTISARAAEIVGAIKNVVVTPTTVTSGSMIRTDVRWCIPDGTTAGDTFWMTLPAQMGRFPAGFDITDSNGEVVASAVFSDTVPAVVTFTVTDYGQRNDNVCGTTFFTARVIEKGPGRP